MVGVAATPSGNSLTKTAGTGWGTGGAISVQELASGDGFVEVIASETTAYRLFGLSNGNVDSSIGDIDFAIYQYSDGRILIYESGNYRGEFATYAPGDRLRVAVEGGVVKYRKNGALLYTSLVAPTYPLLVDTALYTQGATIASAVISDLNSGKSLRNGLVHYWPFEESSGDRFDVVGGWTMSEVNGTLDTIAGKRILAPNFILTGNKHLNRASLVLPTTVTVACWYKVVSPHTVAVFLMATNTWPNLTQFAFYNLGTGALVNIVAVAGDGASITVANDTGALADGYHLLVAEYDASDKTTRLIIDGFVGPKSAALGGTLYRNAAPLNVGYHPSIGQTETPFDELMIWNRVLTPEEHAALYNGGVGRFYPF